MQTFLPSKDFAECARVLDRYRLGKQRVEVHQILRTLNGDTTGWGFHPAVRMWDGYTAALVDYGAAVCAEWVRRGYEDNLRLHIVALDWGKELVMPPWLTDDLCRTYRSLLLRKYPEHYRQYWPDESDRIPFQYPNVPTLIQRELS